MAKRQRALAAGLALAAGILVILVWAPSLFFGPGGPSPRNVSLSNAKQLGAAFKLYAADNDGRLPPADRWSDGVVSYAKAETLFSSKQRGDSWTSFAFNPLVDSARLSEFREPSRTVLLFEVDGKSRNRYASPDAATKKFGEPPRACALFADGAAHLTEIGELLDTRWRP